MKLHAFVATALLAGTALTSHAALVTWGAPTNISGDSDVNTTGTLIGAVHANGGPTTVNGVSFSSIFAGGPSVGPFTLGFSGGFSALAPAGLSPEYQALLVQGTAQTPANNITLTIAGLTVGDTYLFQWWSNAGASELSGFLTSAGGPALDANVGNVDGGAGQFQLGTFTADDATQVIVFDGVGASALNVDALVNAFQLRQAPAVPEPGTALAGVLALGLIGSRRRRR